MAAATRWLRGGWRAQALLYLSAYGAYSATRSVEAGDASRATARARWILHLESSLHLSVERTVQRALDAGAPIWLLNHLWYPPTPEPADA